MLKITSAEFLQGVADLRQLPKNELKEILFIGRSNVGKSSLLNKICARKNLARSSSTPGKTREINYYIINNQFYFVDLPGYGYAKVPEQMRAGWKKLIEDFLKRGSPIGLAMQLIDSRQEPTPLDLMMMDWLEYYEVPYLLVLTKSDKLPTSKLTKQLEAYKDRFHSQLTNGGCCAGIVPFSIVAGDGRAELLKRIEGHFEQSPPRKKQAV
ncbi:MAG: YihA family ribosome biogenesis GTP-binding protein [Ignavibacteriales bacterium]|nr:YihA family ribosome biogenesis GTP-binding protein [Ignavibacteriales bacterium]